MAEGATKCIKFLVFFFNFLFFILGLALLGFGIYAELKLGPYVTLSSVDYATGSRLLIAVGAIIAFISFFGCCGAWKENKCLLSFFFILLFILLGLEIAAAVLGYKNKSKIESDMQKDVEKAMDEYPDKNKKALDDLQKELKCCGATGFMNWVAKLKTIPSSCKCEDTSKDVCADFKLVKYYKRGCVDAFKEFLNDKMVIISALAITLLVIQILGMVLSMCLICKIHKGSYA